MKRKKVPDSEKLAAVNLYIEGRASQGQLAEMYGVRKASVQQWIRNFESMGNDAFQQNFNRRIESIQKNLNIRRYRIILHDKNYSETAEKYGVSYQQARGYTIKYETYGVEGLKDGRGRRKPEDKMNELEKLRAENRILRAQKEQAEMEASFLKNSRR